MILLLQNSRKPVRQTILLIGIIWWVQFQSSNKVSNNTWIYVYIKKTWQNFNSNSNSNSREFQLQFQLQLRKFQLQLQLRPISRISTPTPTPGVSTPTPASLLNINSNSNSGGFNSNSNSNSGVGVEPNSNSNSGVDPNPACRADPNFAGQGPRSGTYFEDCGLMWPVRIPTGFHTPTAGLCKGTVKESMREYLAMLVLPIISLTWVTSFNKVTSIINRLPTLSKRSRSMPCYHLIKTLLSVIKITFWRRQTVAAAPHMLFVVPTQWLKPHPLT